MTRVLKHFIVLAQVVCFAILGWIKFPIGHFQNTFKINTSLLQENIELENCRLYSTLLSSNFVLNYPKSIGINEFGEISLSINKNQVPDSDFQRKRIDDNCEINLEVWIDTKDFQIFPPGRNYEIFNISPSQSFIFTFRSLITGIGTGRIWVFANIKSGDVPGLLRVPLLSLPLEVEIKTVFGISSKLIEVLCWLIIILSGIFWVCLKARNHANDIIIDHD